MMLPLVLTNWLSALALIPSVALADCEGKLPHISEVNVADGEVRWNGSYEPACLRGVEVCWSYPELRVTACAVAPAGARTLRMKDSRPCGRITVRVTAVTGDYKRSDPWPGNGYAAPPKISGLKMTQTSSHVAELSWSSLQNFSCVSDVHLWICENRTEDLSTCIFEAFRPITTSFLLHGLKNCRSYYAVMKTIDKFNNQSSPLTTLPLYLDSATKVTKVKVTNVTQSSAVVAWWVSDANLTCETERLTLCYKEEGNGTSPDCWSWIMDQKDSGDELRLVDLASCTSYTVTVSLQTAVSHSNQTATFTTPTHGETIDAIVANVSDAAALVTWRFDADKLDCRPDSMQVCYSALGQNVTTALCHSLGSATNGVQLYGLASCTKYLVELTLLTSVSPRPTRTLYAVTSSKGHSVLEYMTLTATNTSVRVDWTPVNTSLDCVRLYNVSWYSSDDLRKTWRTFSVDVTSFTILGVSRGQTYYVWVSAVFLDGTATSLSREVYVPARSGSSRLSAYVFLVLCTLLIFVI